MLSSSSCSNVLPEQILITSMHFICPITKQIFLHPVYCAEQKSIYEYDAVKDSSKNLSEVEYLKSMIVDVLELQPSLKTLQYTPLDKNSIEELQIKKKLDSLVHKRPLDYHFLDMLCNIQNLFKYPVPTNQKRVVGYEMDARQYWPVERSERDQYVGWYPLQFICRFGKDVFVKHVLDRENIDLELCDDSGFRAAHLIAAYGSVDVLKHLFSKQVDMEVENHRKRRPIHSLCIRDDITIEMAKLFVEHKVDLNCTDRQNHTPFYYLSLHAPVSVMSYFMNNGMKFQKEQQIDIKLNILLRCQSEKGYNEFIQQAFAE